MGFPARLARTSLGAAAASLTAPLAIVAAAGVVAMGGGFGGLGALEQIASGPALPQAEVTLNSPVTELADTSASGGGGSALASAAPAPGASPTGAPGGGLVPPAPGGGGLPSQPRNLGSPQGPLPQQPPSGSAPAAPTAPPPSSGGGTTTPNGPLAPLREPGQQLTDTARGLPQSLPEPVQPLTQDLLDTLLGPR